MIDRQARGVVESLPGGASNHRRSSHSEIFFRLREFSDRVGLARGAVEVAQHSRPAASGQKRGRSTEVLQRGLWRLWSGSENASLNIPNCGPATNVKFHFYGQCR